jgi:hypothetical protein
MGLLFDSRLICVNAHKAKETAGGLTDFKVAQWADGKG